MYGATTSIGIGLQNSWGTANVSSLFWVPFVSEGVGVNIPPLISQANRGIFDEGEHYAGPITIDGDLSVEAQPIAIGAILAAAFKRPTTTASGSIYNHVFTPTTSDFDATYCAKQPVTILKNVDVGSSMQFSDLNVTSFEFSINNGEFLMATAGFVGGHFQQIARVAPSFDTSKRWTWDQSSVSMVSSGMCEVVQLTFAMDEALEAQHTLCSSSWPNRIKRTGFRAVSIPGTLKFDSQDEYQAFLAQSERLLTANFRGQTLIASGYYNNLKVEVPLLRHTDYKPVAGGPGPIEVSFTSKGVYSVGSGTAIRATLTNTQTAY